MFFIGCFQIDANYFLFATIFSCAFICLDYLIIAGNMAIS